MLSVADVVQRLRDRFPSGLVAETEHRGQMTVEVRVSALVDVCRFLKADPDLAFDFLADVTAVDWKGREPRFELIYHLRSLRNNLLLTVTTRVPESECRAPTMTKVWRGAEWLEREVFDLMGIRFDDHPDLRRIVLPPDFVGHPLRKEFPLRGHDRP